jgi:hypothetical protein
MLLSFVISFGDKDKWISRSALKAALTRGRVKTEVST